MYSIADFQVAGPRSRLYTVYFALLVLFNNEMDYFCKFLRSNTQSTPKTEVCQLFIRMHLEPMLDIRWSLAG